MLVVSAKATLIALKGWCHANDFSSADMLSSTPMLIIHVAVV
jgi:hypothetical protein